jgi:hypothetical protein
VRTEEAGSGVLIPPRRCGSAGRCTRSDGDEWERPGRLYRERGRPTELGGLAGWEWAEAQGEQGFFLYVLLSFVFLLFRLCLIVFYFIFYIF